MSDEPDLLLQQRLTGLNQDLGALHWAEPAAVRARGRELGRRAALTTALAVVFVVGLGSAGAWHFVGATGGTGPGGQVPSSTSTTSPTTTASPSVSPPPVTETWPISVAAGWLIQPSDVGPAWRTQQHHNGTPLSTVEMRLASCSFQPPSMGALRGTGSVSLTTQPESSTIPDRKAIRLADEVLYVFAPGGAEAYLNQWRSLVNQCPVVVPGPNGMTYTSIVEEGFAGDEATMIKFEVRTDNGGGYTDYIALVRRSDRVAVVSGSKVGASLDSSFTRSLAVIAASRMCGTGDCP